MGNFRKIIFAVAVAVMGTNCAKQTPYRTGSANLGSGGPATGGVTTKPPAAPSGLTSSALSASQIILNWTDNSTNETSFRVERAMAAAGPFASGMGPFVALKEVGANVRTFTDSQLQPQTLYYYRVVALVGVTASQPSNQTSATTHAPPSTPPSPPSSLMGIAIAATVTEISWNDGSNNESYFEIERSTNGGASFTQIGTASADVRTFRDINLNASTTYTYRVRARNFLGASNYSNNGAVATLAAGNTATYSYIAANIIGPNCVDCHGPGLASAGYNFSTYNLLNGNRNAAVTAIMGGRMPPGAPLTNQQIAILNSWIAAGTPNN
jgi:mono/diheme cytochrome c family protein